MAIEGGMRKQLKVGMRLVARYKGVDHVAEVIAGPDGKVQFRLVDGRTFKSPSAAGSALMGGVACNGWRFWSLAGHDAPERTAPPTTAPQTPDAGSPAKSRPSCLRCGKQFVSPAQLAYHGANADRLCKPD